MLPLLLVAAGLVVLVGVVAGVVWYSLKAEIKSLNGRLGALELGRVAALYEMATPEVARSVEVPAEADVVGQWAEQMAAAGLRVDSSEVEVQRLMRLEAGL